MPRLPKRTKVQWIMPSWRVSELYVASKFSFIDVIYEVAYLPYYCITVSNYVNDNN